MRPRSRLNQSQLSLCAKLSLKCRSCSRLESQFSRSIFSQRCAAPETSKLGRAKYRDSTREDILGFDHLDPFGMGGMGGMVNQTNPGKNAGRPIFSGANNVETPRARGRSAHAFGTELIHDG